MEITESSLIYSVQLSSINITLILNPIRLFFGCDSEKRFSVEPHNRVFHFKKLRTHLQYTFLSSLPVSEPCHSLPPSQKKIYSIQELKAFFGLFIWWKSQNCSRRASKESRTCKHTKNPGAGGSFFLKNVGQNICGDEEDKEVHL